MIFFPLSYGQNVENEDLFFDDQSFFNNWLENHVEVAKITVRVKFRNDSLFLNRKESLSRQMMGSRCKNGKTCS